MLPTSIILDRRIDLEVNALERISPISEKGYAKMMDLSEKDENIKEAIARGSIYIKKETIKAIKDNKIRKGDVLSVARIGGIMGAKNTSGIIPMNHGSNIYGMDIDFKVDEENCKIDITALVRSYGISSMDMEALTAVSAAALTIYDMCKDMDNEMIISDIHIVKRTGCTPGNFCFKCSNKSSTCS